MPLAPGERADVSGGDPRGAREQGRRQPVADRARSQRLCPGLRPRQVTAGAGKRQARHDRSDPDRCLEERELGWRPAQNMPGIQRFDDQECPSTAGETDQHMTVTEIASGLALNR